MMNRPVIFFDGCCNLCNGAVRFITNHSSKEAFQFVPSQSDIGARYLKAFGINHEQLQTIVYIQDGRIYEKSDAILAICQKLNSGWKLLIVFKIIPKKLRDKPYDMIAQNRYKWFGTNQNCQL